MSFPDYNLNVPARILFAVLPLAGALAPLLKVKSVEATHAYLRADMDYTNFFLVALILSLSVAASEPWARLLAKDKTNVAQTRKASLYSAGVCAAFVLVLLLLHR